MHDRSKWLAVCVVALIGIGCSPGGGGGGDGDGDGDGDGSPDACPCPRPDGPAAPDAPVNGCEGMGSMAAQPFGNHARPYASGTILPNHRSQAELDEAVKTFYNTWKGRYLRPGCGDGRYYVATGHDGSLTVSEAHGYGMLILVYMAGHESNAKQMFDGMFRYYEDHPSDITPGLMSWSQDAQCRNNNGDNSASDGDLDIALALLLADKQWSSGGTINYRAEAENIIDAIKRGDVDSTRSYIKLGDWATSGQFYDATRSSDFMPGHLASFADATGDSTWTQVRDRTYAMVQSLQQNHAPQTGLLPDFIASPRSSPRPVAGMFLERPVDGQYSYNACRDPWRLATDFITNGDDRGRAAVRKMNTWLRGAVGNNPWQIRPGYSLSGSIIGGNYLDNAFVAPFGVAAMVDASNQSWLNDLWDAATDNNDNGYYADTVGMLSLIVMSGNWWTPESAPCP